MQLYRLRIKPLSAWRTPWQSDTLAGLLCWTCARCLGEDVLRNEILDPAEAGRPPFVLSDAFPGDLLPVPLSVRLHDWPADQRKSVKRARWVSSQSFERLQRGGEPALDDLISDSPIRAAAQTRNTLSRSTKTTGDPGSLFSADESLLADSVSYLSVYVHVADGFQKRLLQLFQLLAQSGFGSDASIGKGQFEIDPQLEPPPQLDDIPAANAVVVLSTFQPAPHDPTDGYWEAFTKYGKLGPDFGLDNVFKRPLVLFRSGAVFRTPQPRPFLGRAVPMAELLCPSTAAALADRDVRICHMALGLAVPWQLPDSFAVSGP
jgi:CRISPR-associated protein Csm4